MELSFFYFGHLIIQLTLRPYSKCGYPSERCFCKENNICFVPQEKIFKTIGKVGMSNVLKCHLCLTLHHTNVKNFLKGLNISGNGGSIIGSFAFEAKTC